MILNHNLVGNLLCLQKAVLYNYFFDQYISRYLAKSFSIWVVSAQELSKVCVGKEWLEV